MNKLFLLIFILSLTSVQAYTLQEFPLMFEKEGKTELVVVVPSEDSKVTPAVISLVQGANIELPFRTTKPSEVSSIKQNRVLIGTACENPLVDTIRGYPDNCREGLTPGEGRAELIKENDHYTLILEGYDVQGLNEITRALVQQELRGTKDTAHTEIARRTSTKSVLLRKNRPHHINYENHTYLFELIDVPSSQEAIIKIDGNVQPPENHICPYSTSPTRRGSEYVTIRIVRCIVPEKPEEVQQVENITKNTTVETNKSQKTDSNRITQEENQEKESFFSIILSWFAALFS
jgi:hypothetical protein